MESTVDPGMVSAVEPGMVSAVEPGIEVSESSGHVHSGFDFCISGGYVEHQSGTTQSTVELGITAGSTGDDSMFIEWFKNSTPELTYEGA